MIVYAVKTLVQSGFACIPMRLMIPLMTCDVQCWLLKCTQRVLSVSSQAVLVDKTLYISGQLGLDPEKLELVPGGVEAEAEQMLKNTKAILQSVGADMSNGKIIPFIFSFFCHLPMVSWLYSCYFQLWRPLFCWPTSRTGLKSIQFMKNVSSLPHVP